MKKVTFDSTVKPDTPLVLKAIELGWHVAFVTVSAREAKGTDFEISIKKHDLVPELGVWDEGEWDKMRWADESSSERLETIILIISDGSFPKKRNNLNEGELHQLRDALILEAHIAAKRDVFVSNDMKAFINSDKRSKLEAFLKTRILTHAEFEIELK